MASELCDIWPRVDVFIDRRIVDEFDLSFDLGGNWRPIAISLSSE